MGRIHYTDRDAKSIHNIKSTPILPKIDNPREGLRHIYNIPAQAKNFGQMKNPKTSRTQMALLQKSAEQTSTIESMFSGANQQRDLTIPS